MNSNQIEVICNHFDLGAILKPPKRVHGGLLHKMWRFDNKTGIYGHRCNLRQTSIASFTDTHSFKSVNTKIVSLETRNGSDYIKPY